MFTEYSLQRDKKLRLIKKRWRWIFFHLKDKIERKSVTPQRKICIPSGSFLIKRRFCQNHIFNQLKCFDSFYFKDSFHLFAWFTLGEEFIMTKNYWWQQKTRKILTALSFMTKRRSCSSCDANFIEFCLKLMDLSLCSSLSFNSQR